MVETSKHFILGKLAEDRCLSAYSSSSMSQYNGHKCSVDNHSFFFFWFSKHFFRLCCFSHCFTKQPHKHLHKHDGGAETDTVFKSSAV